MNAQIILKAIYYVNFIYVIELTKINALKKSIGWDGFYAYSF